MNSLDEQKRIQKEVLNNTKENETQYAEATKNEMVQELKNTDLGNKLEKIAEKEPEKPSKWKQFFNKIKRIFYYI